MEFDETQNTPRLTRRAFVQGAVALAGTAGFSTQLASRAANAAAASRPTLIPFDLGHMQLTPGSRLAKATLANANYLLSLSTDRAFYSFRTYAGVDTRGAQPYGGCEAPAAGYRGHFVGHYLSACAKMSQTLKTTQPDLAAKCLARANELVAGFAACQNAIGAKTGADYPGHWGYLNVQSAAQFDRLEALQGADVPYYVIHKIMAGLVDAYNYAGSTQALTVASGMAEYFGWRMSRLSQSTIDAMLNTRRYEGQTPVYFMEHGGMLDVLLDLYRITKDQNHLALAKNFDRSWFRDMLENNDDQLGQNAEHSNTELPVVVGLANMYEVSQDASYKTGVLNFLGWMQFGHEFVTGGVSGKSAYSSPLDYNTELFNSAGLLHRQINSTPGHQGQGSGESCCTHNLNKITKYALAWTGDGHLGDEYEKRFVNAVLSQQHPDSGMLLYNLDLKQGASKGFGSPTNDLWCCYGTGVEAYASLADGAYFHDQSDGVWINNFVASTLNWATQGMTLTQDTAFPDNGHSKLTFTMNSPKHLSVRVRIPFWAGKNASLKVNGVEQRGSKAPGKFAVISRVWKTGDVVDVSLPFSLHTERIPDRPEYVAVKYGPQVLVACTAAGATFAGSAGSLLSALTPTGNPCEFTAPLSSGKITFKPLNRITSEAYNAYTIVTEPPLEQVQDKVLIADAASETAHHLQSSNSNTGAYNGQSWRDASNNGFITYTLAVHPVQQTYLKCVYWGSEVGNDGFWRLFDIQALNPVIDHQQVIATQSLDKEAPNAWYDVIYPIPLAMTTGKTSLTVTFQAKGFQNKPGCVGGLFDHIQTHCYAS